MRCLWLLGLIVTLVLPLSRCERPERYTTLTSSYTPGDFFRQFDFVTFDPTYGKVQYLPRDQAYAQGLVREDSTIFMGVDTVHKAPAGRPAVRIESKARYDGGLFILDVEHMPWGCGVWPAFWTFGDPWPHVGEIDIIEGVHNQDCNIMAVHKHSDGCDCDPYTLQSGQTGHAIDPCSTCQADMMSLYRSVYDTRSSSYGSAKYRGGVYAMEWTAEAIKVWFFPRDQEPPDAIRGIPSPETWGMPAYHMPMQQCEMARKFKQHRIVLNITFCGQWAGAPTVWHDAGCVHKAPTCEQFVSDNPEAFREAYWRLRSLKVWNKAL